MRLITRARLRVAYHVATFVFVALSVTAVFAAAIVTLIHL